MTTQAGLYRRAYSIAHCAYSAHPWFGILFLEVMALGRPSIGASTDAVPEIIPSQAGALFPHGDDAALAQAIEETVSRSRRGAAGSGDDRQDLPGEVLSWPLFAQRWNSVVRG